MTALPWRLAGVVVLAVSIVLYEPTATGAVHRLVIPVVMAVATWMMVQNAAAVLLGAGALAAIHGEPGSTDWITGRAYPLLALVCAAGFAAILAMRFVRRIRDTRAARWEPRQRHQPGPDGNNP